MYFGCEHKNAIMALAVVVEQLAAGGPVSPAGRLALDYLRAHMFADNYVEDVAERRRRHGEADKLWTEFSALLRSEVGIAPAEPTADGNPAK